VIASDLQVLFHLLRGQPSEGSHAQRLQAFYAPQAERYDAFRERLLHGRSELISDIHLPAGARLAELGGGTGRNLLFFGERLSQFGRVHLVDLCPALLEQARYRFVGEPKVDIVEADVTHWQAEAPLDCVIFSYALTMIPDWRAAIDNAVAQLGDDGCLAVVDFYVSAIRPDAALRRHSAFTRWFWPKWFGHDGVALDPQRLDYLRAVLPNHQLVEGQAPVPYLPGMRVPFYRFIGRRA
jgi:S-adenosylmethionine-diacylgycerolhomoserine-N-methlytransferase